MSLWRGEVIMKACPQMHQTFSVRRTRESYFELIFFSHGATHQLSLCKTGARLKKWRLDATSSSAIVTQQVQLTYLPVILLRSEQKGFVTQHVLVFVLPAAVSGAQQGSARSATGHTNDSYSALLWTVSPTSPWLNCLYQDFAFIWDTFLFFRRGRSLVWLPEISVPVGPQVGNIMPDSQGLASVKQSLPNSIIACQCRPHACERRQDTHTHINLTTRNTHKQCTQCKSECCVGPLKYIKLNGSRRQETAHNATVWVLYSAWDYWQAMKNPRTPDPPWLHDWSLWQNMFQSEFKKIQFSQSSLSSVGKRVPHVDPGNWYGSLQLKEPDSSYWMPRVLLSLEPPDTEHM